MVEMRWLEYTAKYPETNGGYETRKKLQYRTWKSESPSSGSWTIERVWTDWMDVPTVELENKNV